MSQEENLAAIKRLYEAFGRGDVEAILEIVADDVDWGVDSAGTQGPWYGHRSNKQEVAQFFADIAGAVQVEDFTPLAYGTSDDEVFSLVRFGSRSIATGRAASMNLHHYFRFSDGKIAYWRGSEDTAQTGEMLAG